MDLSYRYLLVNRFREGKKCRCCNSSHPDKASHPPIGIPAVKPLSSFLTLLPIKSILRCPEAGERKEGLIDQLEQIHNPLPSVLNEGTIFLATFIYAFNKERQRKKLWHDLISLNDNIDRPWVVAGDFHSAFTHRGEKRLKARLKTWSKQTYGVTAIKLEEIRGRLSLVQTELDKDPSDLRLQSMEKKDLLDLLNHTLSIEEAELRQKSPPHVRGLCDPFVKVRESPLGILGTLLIKAHLISGLTLGFIAMFYGIYYQIELFLQT
ncbi:putative ovule protein [Forsythia ovata]|uniref:Ovule protein n=1 Tax=Forsythia ovata TaxID=205694 RepID=A0ABD1P087_9LAMI